MTNNNMILRKNSQTFFLSPQRLKSTPYLFETIEENNPHLRTLLFNAFVMYFFQKLEILEDLHQKIEERDPTLYGHLAAIFVSRSFSSKDFIFYRFLEPFLIIKVDKITHHRPIFLAHLLTARNFSLRQIGIKLIHHCPVNELSAALDYCKKIAHKFPRSARTAIKTYLRELEKNEVEFDSNLIHHKGKLKHLYASLHIKPSERAEAILFKRNPPPDSLAGAINILQTEFDPDTIFKAIEKYNIPYPDAIKNIRYFSYAIAEKIIDRSSPEILAESYPLLQKRGIMKNEDLFLAIRAKIKTNNLFHRNKPHKLISNKIQYSPEELRERAFDCLAKLKNNNVHLSKKISLLVDCSGSMYDYKEIGKGFIYILGNLSEPENFSVYLFDKEAKKINVYNNSEWLNEFDSFNLDKSGSCFGAPLEKMVAEGEDAEVICIISDGNENVHPMYFQAYKEYIEKQKSVPYTILIKTGYFSANFEENIKKSETPVMITEFNSYYETISDIFSILGSKPAQETIEQILSIDLSEISLNVDNSV